MKGLQCILLGSIILAALSYVGSSHASGKNDCDVNQIETLTQAEHSDSLANLCLKGGPGKTYCEIDANYYTRIGRTGGGCSVTCADGYYACCGAHCYCKPTKAN